MILLVPLALAQDLSEIVQEIDSEIQGNEIPSPIDKIFGDERINIHIDTGDETIVLALITQDAKVEGLSQHEVEDPSLNAYTTEKTIVTIMESNDPLASLTYALDNKDITYEAVGVVNKFKFFFVNIFIKITGSMSSDEFEVAEFETEKNDELILITETDPNVGILLIDGTVVQAGDLIDPADLEYRPEDYEGEDTFEWKAFDGEAVSETDDLVIEINQPIATP